MDNYRKLEETERSFLNIAEKENYTDSILTTIMSENKKLEERIEKLEKFLEKIMPLLPDNIKLFLEVSEEE